MCQKPHGTNGSAERSLAICFHRAIPAARPSMLSQQKWATQQIGMRYRIPDFRWNNRRLDPKGPDCFELVPVIATEVLFHPKFLTSPLANCRDSGRHPFANPRAQRLRNPSLAVQNGSSNRQQSGVNA